MHRPMKILTASQIREADTATMQHEPIASIDLMERASRQFTRRFVQQFPERNCPIYVFCGLGNNGGDGLAIARMLLAQQYDVSIYIVGSGTGSDDFEVNRKRLAGVSQTGASRAGVPWVHHIEKQLQLPQLSTSGIIVDALFGSGLNRGLEGLYAKVVQLINANDYTVVAVDIPSGLYADQPVGKKDVVIQADFTYSFQLPYLAFLLPRNEIYVGEWAAVDIGLNDDFLQQAPTPYYYLTHNWVRSLHRKRKRHSHKGNYGRALIISGSHGKMGAAVLCSRACARGGVGLLTVHVPYAGYEIMQTTVPEAMVTVDPLSEHISYLPEEDTIPIEDYDAIGIGPGLGTKASTAEAVQSVLKEAKRWNLRLVLDADALNICGQYRDWLNLLPKNTILTPHPKEFERLTEKAQNDFHRLELLKGFCKKYQVYVILKGAHTAISTPEGVIYFNSTGNPGMATGGSGDVLTGVLTALVAQGYDSLSASLLGVHLHGLAGDLAAEKLSRESLIASDIVEHLGRAFATLY